MYSSELIPYIYNLHFKCYNDNTKDSQAKQHCNSIPIPFPIPKWQTARQTTKLMTGTHIIQSMKIFFAYHLFT